MSAWEVAYKPQPIIAARPRLRLVGADEVPVSVHRKAFARVMARGRVAARAKVWAMWAALSAAFMTGAISVVQVFLAIPNTPMP